MLENWNITYCILAILFCIVSFLPILDSKHWTVRVFDFIRLQILAVLVIILIMGFIVNPEGGLILIIVSSTLVLTIIYQLTIVLPYIPPLKKKAKKNISPNSLSLLTANVLQKNENYDSLLDIINETQPDIILTTESNQKWEDALSNIESAYDFSYKIPKENRYGMHFFTKLNVKSCKEHYLISENHPSVEVLLTDKENNSFIFWGIPPPPPSPTEKATSKQKDAELMKVAELVSKSDMPTIVAGDFNNVSWSKSSKMFSRISELRDARIKRGILGTFPARYWFLRFPVDLLFHSISINIYELKTLAYFGSDYLPLFSIFDIQNPKQESKKKISSTLKGEIDKVVDEGKKSAKAESKKK